MNTDNQRPKSITVSSILNFIFAGLGIVYAMINLVTSSAFKFSATSKNLSPEVVQMMTTFGILTCLFSLAVGGIAIVSGIGLIQVARWGRSWTYSYAIAAIASGVINAIGTVLLILSMTNSAEDNHLKATLFAAAFGIAMALPRIIYPVILLFFLRSTTWKQAFASNTLGTSSLTSQSL